MLFTIVLSALLPGNEYSDYFANLHPSDFRSVRVISFSTPEPSGDAGFATGLVRDTAPNVSKRIPVNKWLARLIMATDCKSDLFRRIQTRIMVDLVDGNQILVTDAGIAQLKFKLRPKTPATVKFEAGDIKKFSDEVELIFRTPS
jgi:hypothetical protein